MEVKMTDLFLGSHVDLSAPDYLVGAVKTSIAQGANTFMIYTGAPQNSMRKPIETMSIEAGIALMKEAGMDPAKIVVHAPYIINLGNTVNAGTFDIGITFLIRELQRVQQMGFTMLVLHPGAHVGAGSQLALDKIVSGLDKVLSEDGTNVKIALETMSGKGSEVGITFEEIRYIIDHSAYPHRFGVCLDTCHVSDAGYDLTDVDGLLKEFDRVIGLDRLLVVHINDSKNPRGAKKDRHENLGYGTIGFDVIRQFVYHPSLKGIPKILETPYFNDKPPYKDEISMLKKQQFIPGWRDGY
jgi:deoxyribonuclease IV